jgi:5-methylcytosine-specific restriction endonuclease McrA
MAEKACCRCKVAKSAGEFSRYPKSRDGLNYHCKACEKLARQGRDYSGYDRDRRDRDKKRQQDREYRLRNLDRLRAAGRAKHARDPEATIERMRRWRAANPEKAREHGRRDKARRALGRRGTPEEIAYVKAVQHDPCAYCGEPGRELDHVVPVAAGGEPGWSNLASACRRCNATKNDSPLWGFLLRHRAGARPPWN